MNRKYESAAKLINEESKQAVKVERNVHYVSTWTIKRNPLKIINVTRY